MRKNFPLTIEQMFNILSKQIALGNGKKYILVSNDEEGNGFHECYYGVTDATEAIGDYQDYPSDLNLEDCVTLG